MTTPSWHGEPARRGVDRGGGVEAPIRPVLAGRRGLRQQAGVVAVAAVAITVIAAGIGLGGRGTEPLPGPSAAPATAHRTSDSASASRSPAPGVPSGPPPTELPGLGCLPATPGALPQFRLGSSDGAFEPVLGVVGPPDWALSSPPSAAWPIPEQRIALALDPSAAVVLVPDGGVCVRYAVAEYLGISDLGKTPTALGLSETNVNPPRPRVVLGTLPPGDWVIRVVAYYSTGVAGDEDQAVEERFFRVITGLGPGASPLISPAVPCVPLASDAPLPRFALVAGDAEPVLGVDLATYPGDMLRNGALVSGTFPDRLELRVVGDGCATSWRIQYLDYLTGSDMSDVVQDNVGEIPFFVSQNRIELRDAVLGQVVVLATVNFGRNRTATAAWELTLAGAPPPSAVVIGSNGARATARAGCGVGWTLASGRSAYEACLPINPVPGDLELLAVRSRDTVRIDVPGWRIVSWYVSCGQRSPFGGTYQEDTGCGLGGGGDGTHDAGPAIFIPFPGRHVVSAWISADRDGTMVGAQYFVEVDAGP